MVEYASMLEMKITSWTGLTQAPIVVAVAPPKPDEPQAGTKPALRLIQGGKS